MCVPILACPRCSREWQITGDGWVRCSSCGYETDSYTGAIEYIRIHKGLKSLDGIDAKSKPQIYSCPACGALALLERAETDLHANFQFLCFSCGGFWAANELARCPECMEWKPGEEFEELIICRSAVGFYVCRACYEKIFK